MQLILKKKKSGFKAALLLLKMEFMSHSAHGWGVGWIHTSNCWLPEAITPIKSKEMDESALKIVFFYSPALTQMITPLTVVDLLFLNYYIVAQP